jgi:hypothetical protein
MQEADKTFQNYLKRLVLAKHGLRSQLRCHREEHWAWTGTEA